MALAAKAATDKVPVGVLILAAYSNDILKLGFKAVGLEKSSNLYINIEEGIRSFTPGNMPWSHGLFMSVIWALLAALIAFLIYHDRRAAIVIGSVVVSHWFLDFIVHPPELPIFFSNSRLYGLGLWTTATGFKFSVLLEIGMMVGGLTIYFVQRRKRAMTLAKNSH
jgi:membrane-bound metal-dependent hydrolase YbcI (DUF457 family)